MSEPAKDTVYIDVDEEITGIIEKVKGSDKKIVALVLPKRATVLQSIVNMKLLKRTADRSKKNLVLITSEASLMPLAGAVGLHVAKNLQSKPEIPDGPPSDEIPDSLVHEEEIEPEEKDDVDKDKSVGELAGVAAAGAVAGAAASKDGEADAIEPDEISPDESAAADEKTDKKADKKADKAAKKSKDKDLKVPSFERFRKWFIFGGIALVGLIVLIYFMFWVWPKAVITVDADATNVTVNATFTADTTTKSTNLSTSTLPAESKQIQKNGSQSVATTGTKNIGNKATGSVSLTTQNCNGIVAPDLPAGSVLTANGMSYTTQAPTHFTFKNIANNCNQFKATGPTAITASAPGTAYNTSDNNQTFTGSGATGTGGANGGTDNNVQVVTQNDINSAKNQLSSVSDPNAQSELSSQLQTDGMFPIKDSFTTTGPTYTNSANVGDQANNVTVTANITYTMLGVDKNGVQAVITSAANGQIDTTKQSVINTGYTTASYTIQGNIGAQTKIAVQSQVLVGPKLNFDQIKQQVTGKKKADTITIVESWPSVKNVTVTYSPFYVSKTPSNTKHISIVFKQASN